MKYCEVAGGVWDDYPCQKCGKCDGEGIKLYGGSTTSKEAVQHMPKTNDKNRHDINNLRS